MPRFQHEDEAATFAEVVPAEREPEFLLMFHPLAWEFVEAGDAGGEWLPRLKQFRLTPGVNGVKPAKHGGHIHAKAEHEAQGWGFLLADIIVGSEVGYLRSFQGRNGKIYKDRWTTPHVVGAGRNARVTWTFDDIAYNAWRKALVAGGHIPPIDPSVQASITDLQRGRVQRRAVDAHAGANPAVQARQAAQVERLAAMEGRAEVVGAPEPSGAPAPSRGGDAPPKRRPGRPPKVRPPEDAPHGP